MAKASRPQVNPYAASAPVLRSDMPEGYVPPDELPGAPPPRRLWSRVVVWTLRAGAGLQLALATASVFYAFTAAAPAEGKEDERKLIEHSPLPPPTPSQEFAKTMALQQAFQRTTTALLFVGIAEAIALLLAAADKQHRPT